MMKIDTKLSARYKAIADETVALEEADTKRGGDPDEEASSKPRPPAKEADVLAAEKKRKRTFSNAYRTFLLTMDGWDDFSWGTQLYGTKELRSNEQYDDDWEVTTYGDDPLPKELARSLMIGASINDGSRVLLLESGEVVDWMYEERIRYKDLATYLGTQKTALLEMAESARKAKKTTEDEWDPKNRAKEDSALEKELTLALKAWKKEAASDAPPAPAPAPAPSPSRSSTKAKAMKPQDLVLKKGKEIVAEVGLGLVLYLGATPSKSEVVATFRAFRKRFPVKGPMQWALAQEMTFGTNDAKSADDESFIDQLKVDDYGHFGVRANITLAPKKNTKSTYWINIRGIPPQDADDSDEDTDDDDDAKRKKEKKEKAEKEEKKEKNAKPAAPIKRASFIEVFVPSHEDPKALEALAKDLLEILPVIRSGHGGFFAHVWDDEVEPDPWNTVFDWCRRFFGVEAAQVDGWLVAARKRLRGAGWLTFIGKPFVKAFGKALTTSSKKITRIESKHGSLLLKAGPTPSLGDVARGEFPTDIGAVAQLIEPLVLGSYAKSGMFSTGGIYWSTFTDELPGSFVDHHATALYLHRFTRPQAFIGPTPREEGEALLEKLVATTKEKDILKEWRAEVKSDSAGFSDLLHAVTRAAHPLVSKPLGVEALEFVVRYPGWAPNTAFNNLLFGYLALGRFDDALTRMDDALKEAPNNPSIYHNAACIFSRHGDATRALDCIALAKQHGYDKMSKLKSDTDLDLLRTPKYKKRFLSLFTN